MKIKLLIFSLLFSVVGWGQVNITPLHTGTIASFSSWTHTTCVQGAASGNDYMQMTTATSLVKTPVMDFRCYSGMTLDFKARTFGGPTAAQATISVSISTNNGGSWVLLGTRVPASTTVSAMTQFNISAYSGSQVLIKLETLGAGAGKGVGIDDIDVKGVLLTPTTTSISPNSALSGDPGFTLTVNGTNFNTGSVVQWNGSPRTTTFVSATQVTATIPASDVASVGSANVTVLNSCNPAASNAQTFTINPGTSPTVVVNQTGYNGAFGNQCVGMSSASSSYTVSGTNLTNDIIINAPAGFEIKTGAGAWGSSVTLVQSGGNVAVTTIDVRFTPVGAGLTSGNINNTSTGATTTTVAVSGTGIAPATPTVSTAGSPSGAICAGTSVTFTATPSNLGGGTASYQWTLNSVNVGAGTTYTNAALVNGDLIGCVLTVTGGCITISATSATDITMIVNSPAADPTGSIAVSANPSCGSATLSYPAGSYWQTTAGGTSLASPTSSNYTLNTTGTIYVRGHNGSCWSVNSINTGVITINTAAGITTQPINQNATLGSTATFTAVATNASGYQWQVSTDGGGTWSNVGTNSSSYTTPVTIASMNNYQYKVIVSGVAPCGNITSNAATLFLNTGACIDENFNAFTGASFGSWTATGMGNYTTAASAGLSVNSAQFNSSTDQLLSPVITKAAELSFWFKGNGTDAASALLIEGFNGVSWVTVQNISPLPTVGTTKIYNASSTPALPANIQQFRFTYTKSVGNLAFDDVKVLCALSPNISVSGNNVVIGNGDVTPTTVDGTDFGTVGLSLNSSHSFIINNTGEINLNVSTVTFVGGNAADFSVSTTPATTISSGLDGFLGIRFTPSANGIRTTTVQIANNVPGKSPYTFTIQGTGLCTAGNLTSVSPNNGPVNTNVTIVSSGDLTGSTVTFNGVPATIISNTVSQLVVVVPVGATSGDILITNSSGCKSATSFTVVSQDITSCEGSSTITDLFISEVTDASSGSLSYIEIHNATGAAVNLASYEVRIRNNGAATGDDIPLSGMLANGASFTLATSIGTACNVSGGNGSLANQHNVSAGVNNNDCIHLAKSGTDIDVWGVCDGSTWITTAGFGTEGYDFERKNNVAAPSTSFNITDWTTHDFVACNDDYSHVNSYAGLATPPVINTQPVAGVTCTSTNAVFTVTATEGFGGSNALAYQWYSAATGSATWTAVTDGGVYSGATTNSLSVSAIAGLMDYQFYCQVREDNATCYIATNAIQLGTYSTTWNGSSWSNGTPNSVKTAVINGNYNTTTHGDIDACSLTVNATFTATVTANHYVNIENNLTVNGVLDIQDNGSLIQVSDSGVNTGNIFMKRIATVKLLDYVFWSSPVNNFAVAGISPATPLNVIWKWNPSVANPNNGFGNWQNANESMNIGKGYIVRAPNGFNNTTAQDFTANFVGVANNGIKDVAIERGNFTGTDYNGTNGTLITKNEDNWNLIGNPYPSAINAKDFLALNANIEGSVRLWTHGTLPNTTAANPFYSSYAYNYSATDYIVYNATGPSTQDGFDGYIGAGQSFFVLMNDGPAASETVRFQNSLRNKTHRNDQFYRNSNAQNSTSSVERHRIWIDLVSSAGTVNRTLIGYIEGATQGKDRLFDAYSDHKSAQDFYSVVNNESMIIQGRALPFADSDLVPMGFKAPANGTYTIAIASVDGLFSGNAQTIYLEDKLLNTIHNLSVTPYQFTTNKGIVDNRFVIRYTNQALGNDDFDVTNNNVKIYPSNNEIKIDSSTETIQSYMVYDVLGRVLAEKNNVKANQSAINSISKNNQALIVKVILENGQTVTKKIIF